MNEKKRILFIYLISNEMSLHIIQPLDTKLVYAQSPVFGLVLVSILVVNPKIISCKLINQFMWLQPGILKLI